MEESIASEEDRLVSVFGLGKEAGGIVKVVENALITEPKDEIVKRGVAEGMVGGGATNLSVEVDEEVDDGTDKGKGKEGEKPKKETHPDEDGLTRLMRLLRRVGADEGVKPVWGDWVRVSPSFFSTSVVSHLTHRLAFLFRLTSRSLSATPRTVRSNSSFLFNLAS